MDKKTALTILIQTSSITDAQKEELLHSVETMLDEEIEALGIALATQRKDEIQKAENALQALDSLPADLE